MNDPEILRAIERDHGRVTADNVVKAASDPVHPWHNRFDWNDATAAQHHRLDQARMLIRSIHYRTRTESRVLSSPAYVRDPDAMPHEQGYSSVVSLRSDAERARAVVFAEVSRVLSAYRRARAVADVLGLDAAIDRMIGEAEGLRHALLDTGEGEPAAA